MLETQDMSGCDICTKECPPQLDDFMVIAKDIRDALSKVDSFNDLEELYSYIDERFASCATGNLLVERHGNEWRNNFGSPHLYYLREGLPEGFIVLTQELAYTANIRIQSIMRQAAIKSMPLVIRELLMLMLWTVGAVRMLVADNTLEEE